jgi:hypothetical protein
MLFSLLTFYFTADVSPENIDACAIQVECGVFAVTISMKYFNSDKCVISSTEAALSQGWVA